MRENPKPQQIFRHFKGNFYQIITIALDSETREKKVVYQQLYSPFRTYVRSLDMFMSRIDNRKYPDAGQKYRFELMSEEEILGGYVSPAAYSADVSPRKALAAEKNVFVQKGEAKEKDTAVFQTTAGNAEASKDNKSISQEVFVEGLEAEAALDEGVLAFLEAETYDEKLKILTSLHNRIDNQMINTMAISLDIEVDEGDIETRYDSIKKCLAMQVKFECDRLR